jgi:hypothetical protein
MRAERIGWSEPLKLEPHPAARINEHIDEHDLAELEGHTTAGTGDGTH